MLVGQCIDHKWIQPFIKLITLILCLVIIVILSRSSPLMVLFRFLLKEMWQGKLFCQSFSRGQLVVWIVGQSVVQSVS